MVKKSKSNMALVTVRFMLSVIGVLNSFYISVQEREKSIRDYQGLWSKQKYKHDGIKLIL